jgi:hypothetical protein
MPGQPAYPYSGAPPRRPWWKRPGGIVAIVAGGVLTLGLLLCGGLLALGVAGNNAAEKKIDAKVTSCRQSDGPLATAHVGLEVHNGAATTRTIRVHVEYRDAAGKRIDIDTAVLRDVAAGDTVAHEEGTVLAIDTPVTCAITGTDVS